MAHRMGAGGMISEYSGQPLRRGGANDLLLERGVDGL